MKALILLLMVAFAFGINSTAQGQTTGTAAVTLNVSAVNALSVSGNPGTMIVNSATPGSEPAAVTNALTTYAYSSNGTNKKITGALNQGMGSNLTMEVQLAAPTGGSSAGYVSMSTTSQNLANGITKRNESAKTVTYRFTARVAAGVLSSTQKTLTLTLIDGP